MNVQLQQALLINSFEHNHKHLKSILNHTMKQYR